MPSQGGMPLDALVVGITSTRVNYILDADIRSFFDDVSQSWLARFEELSLSPQTEGSWTVF